MEEKHPEIFNYLKSIYLKEGHPAAYSSPYMLYSYAKPYFPSITVANVRDFLQQYETYSLHKQIKKPKQFRKTIAAGINHIHQSDLCDLTGIKKYNDQNTFLLVNIDVFSRQLCAVPIKSKLADDIVQGFKKVHTQQAVPLCLHTDAGKEFLAKKTQSYFKSKNIHHYLSFSDQKAAICERVIRTLKRLMWSYFTNSNTLRYIEILPKLLSTYNNRYHRTLKCSPNEVNETNVNSIWQRQYGTLSDKARIDFKFSVGDTVRIIKYKNIFTKSYLPGWKQEIFIIHKRYTTNPVTYTIKSYETGELIQGRYYNSELTKIKLPQK